MILVVLMQHALFARPMQSLSILVPLYNEESTIEALLRRVLAQPHVQEVIVVDDASADGSAERVETIAAGDSRVRLIRHEANSGKGAAIRTALAAATADIVLIQDADLEYDPVDYARVVAPIQDGRADAVFGSRFLGSEAHRVLYFWHALGNRFLTLLSNAFTNLNLTDMECCYKAAKREVFQSVAIEENRFGIEPELAAKLAARNLRIFEVSVSYNGRTYQEGKKIGWKDGVRALVVILRYGLFVRPGTPQDHEQPTQPNGPAEPRSQ